MERIELPHVALEKVCHLIDWAPTPTITADAQLLKRLTKGRRSRTGIAQSEISRKRQNFISGMSLHRLAGDERQARQHYAEEWRARITENEFI